MIATFLRSSMITSFDLCQHKFFIDYCIGIKSPTSKSAAVGNVVHKLMELLARQKICQQNNQSVFNDDLLGEIDISNCQPFYLLDQILEQEKDMQESDRKDCIKCVKSALTSFNGVYDPRNCTIIDAEKPFDYTINKPWGKYSFDTPDGKLEGQLMLRGTIDLIIQHDKDTYELRDYKTGRVWDWGKNKEKNEESLYKDPQLMLYYYAACHTFPKIKNILFTIYFIKYDKPFLIAFDRSDLPEIEKFLAKKYKEIVNNIKPKLNISFRCRFCPFYKQIYKDSEQTICEYFRDEVKNKGIQQTMNDNANWKSLTHYGSGGGHEYRI